MLGALQSVRASPNTNFTMITTPIRAYSRVLPTQAGLFSTPLLGVSTNTSDDAGFDAVSLDRRHVDTNHEVIPKEVLTELAANGAPLEVAEWIRTRPSWIEVASVSHTDFGRPTRRGTNSSRSRCDRAPLRQRHRTSVVQRM